MSVFGFWWGCTGCGTTTSSAPKMLSASEGLGCIDGSWLDSCREVPVFFFIFYFYLFKNFIRSYGFIKFLTITLVYI